MRLFVQLLVLVACTDAVPAQPATHGGDGTNIVTNVTASYVLYDKHILGPGDTLSFRIVEDKDPPKPLIVTDSLELDVPYIGRVSIANKTCKQAANQLKSLLEEKYYYHATVILGLDSVNKLRGKVYVEGQVRSQGAVDLVFDQKLTAGKAILLAGGFADFANKRKVKVVRSASDVVGSAAKTFEIDMVEVLENGRTDRDIPLEPNDYIIVPTRSVNF
jgi:protein involved in polysaccharide export with SLBB domain